MNNFKECIHCQSDTYFKECIHCQSDTYFKECIHCQSDTYFKECIHCQSDTYKFCKKKIARVFFYYKKDSKFQRSLNRQHMPVTEIN